MWSTVKAPSPADLACVFGMGLGFLVDVWRSPVGIPLMCMGSDGIPTRMLGHVIMMPSAHLGMAIGGILSVLFHLGKKRATQPVTLILALLWNFGGMVATEAGALAVLQRSASAALAMSVMAFFMIAIGCLPWPTCVPTTRSLN